ncbi:cell division initiation protein [Aquiflexum balticum DSM 16537]|uniref:Cell division initiation protein n=1 Tax=Aquiflexum balticum DSM 16537 TaxID=758820 RepID=A0A1W2H6X5_9BACT|nr:DivIVA domain-containing protein [Aquiflexum balticum]SMD44256.1 cell division initiation protein [Aquiflexum balticum DSM 16537]
MKITSKEISDKTFEKNFRGYDKDEVTAYLNVLAGEWDRIQAEKSDLEKRLEISEKEANKLKQVEESLFRTLKTAEDTGASIIEEANFAAEEIMNEAHQNAGSILNEAQSKSKNLIESAEAKGKEIMENLKADVSNLVESYETLLKQRDLIIKNLKAISEDIENNISVSKESFKKINIQTHADVVNQLSKANAFTIANIQEFQKEEEMTASHSQQEEITAESHEDISVESEIQTEEDVVIENQIPEIDSPAEKEEEPQESGIEENIQKIPSEEEIKSKTNKGGSFFDQFD